VCKYSFAQVSDAISTFTADFSPLQHQHVQQELDRIALWLSSCPFEFIGSSVLLAHDTQRQGGAVHVNFIDFGHVEQAGPGANAGNIMGIRTLQKILQKFVQTSAPGSSSSSSSSSSAAE
jgi:hypothetical protein